MMIRRASLAPPTTGPPANTVSPADSALVVVLPPFFLTTVSLTTCQVQVVPSAALITTLLPLTDWMMPRSNESVWKPVLLWNVAVASTPPRWRSRPSAQRTRAGGMAGLPAASLSAVFRAAACALEAPEAGALPPDTAAQVIPPPARRPNTAAPTPQRYQFFLPADRGGSAAPAGCPPSAGALYMVFIPVSVGPGSWTSPGSA